MGKKIEKMDYGAFYDWLPGKNVNVGLKTGGVLAGDVEHIDKDIVVLVNRPKSTLDLETKVVHTIVYHDKIDFIQFKTERE